jgi:hypothetical protein
MTSTNLDMTIASLTRPITVEEFLRQIDIRLEEYTLEAVGKPLGASRQLVFAWKSRRARPSPLRLLLARYVWTFGKLPE